MNTETAAASPPRRRSPTYLWLSLAISATAFYGFSLTYFGRVFTGQYPEVSPTVHVHGWSFFLWYLLLPLQAGLVQVRRVAVHRAMGLACIGLVLVMVVTGTVVLGVQVDLAQQPDGSEFWLFLGLGILSNLVLFAGFYVWALLKRKRPQDHKRLMILASVGGLGAATFRIVGPPFAFSPTSQVVGILLPNLILVAAMLLELRSMRGVHRIYRVGFPASVLATGVALLVTPTPLGSVLFDGLAWLGRLLGPLY